MEELKKNIRSVPDFPKKGINFYDITTLIENTQGFGMALDGMQKYIESRGATKLVGVEARGFIFGAALADRMNLPLVLARKPGKLPFAKISEEYKLEYGTDKIEMHVGAVEVGDKVVVVDDLIATGGTLLAACHLVERAGAEVVGISVVIGLPFLPYVDRLGEYNINSLIDYDSE